MLKILQRGCYKEKERLVDAQSALIGKDILTKEVVKERKI